MIIECNEISQTVNQLLVAFQDCNKVKNSDLRKLVNLISAVSTCNNGGPSYDTTVIDEYITSQIVIYPPNTLHSYSLNVISGSIEYAGFILPAGSTRNVEYTNLNQDEIAFTVNAGSQVLFEYLIENV